MFQQLLVKCFSCVLPGLSLFKKPCALSMTFFIDELFEGHSCGGFCPFLVMNSRVLKKLHIMYYRRQVKPEDADKL
jgi:polyferredoxin